MNKLFHLDSTEELREWARAHDDDVTRKALLTEFSQLRDYTDATEWNRLVRVCEALAILGWGAELPVEAVAERWIDGALYSRLQKTDFTAIDPGERRWARRGGLFVLDGAGPDTAGRASDSPPSASPSPRTRCAWPSRARRTARQSRSFKRHGVCAASSTTGSPGTTAKASATSASS